jgi:NitT/TauT family transport system substrate-binding protein
MSSSALRTVEFGTPSNNDALSVRFGISEGVFERLGVDLRMRTLFGGPAIADAFDSGEIGIGSLGSPSGLVPISAGARFKVVGSGCRQAAHMYLGVRKEIGSYAELKGCRIGVLSIGSCPSWIVHRMLQGHGLDQDTDVALVPLHDKYPKIIDLIAEGELDACLVTEPNLSIGESRGLLDVWAAAYEAPYLPRFQWIVRVANEQLLQHEPELVEAVLGGCNASARMAASRGEAFVHFVADYYGVDAEAVRAGVGRELSRYQLDGTLDLDGLGLAVDMMHELGGIQRKLELESFCDLRFQ